MSESDKQLVQYLAELAVTNPQQLPLALTLIMKHRLTQLLIDRMSEIADNSMNVMKTELDEIEQDIKNL